MEFRNGHPLSKKSSHYSKERNAQKISQFEIVFLKEQSEIKKPSQLQAARRVICQGNIRIVFCLKPKSEGDYVVESCCRIMFIDE